MASRKAVFLYVVFLAGFTTTAFVLLVHVLEYRRLQQLVPPDYLQPDPQADFVRKPNTSLQQPFAEHPAGILRKQYNNYGFLRHDSTQQQKREGVRRILFTGDSHTDGLVWNEENFCTLLEDSLHLAGQPAEVLNAGTGYYTFRQYEGVLLRNLHLQPDDFVVVVYAGNDFVETLFYDFRWYNPLQSLRQFRARLGWRYRYPVLYNNQSLTQVYYFHLYPFQVQPVINEALAAVGRMQAICHRNGIRFHLVLLPSDFDLLPGYQEKVRLATGLTSAALAVNTTFSRALAAFCQQLNIPFLDLALSLQYQSGAYYYPRDHHLNAPGNRVVAQRLTRYFLQEQR
ncbi:MAG TPA: GDSL-type esterase/lipase family protein [Lacibacter sp.]|nr:GDSL-type esterase/lipase family protein [Lacibacter sp.]HMO89377.1 GDSL-type esterase/lipase family protein [Lacibacter sp.]HMP85915.1 GDSL-type esterase/lipase family protein [Lacibacter sp.]